MKTKGLILCIYPAIAIILLIATVVLFKDWWTVSVTGEETEGRIEAVFFQRQEGPNALLTDVDTHLELTRADGTVLDVYYEEQIVVRVLDDGQLISFVDQGQIQFTEDEELNKTQTAELRDIVEGKKDRVNWFLLRQKRQGGPEAFTRLEKKETATLWKGLPEDFNAFEFDPVSGRVVPTEGKDAFTVSTLITHAVFSYEDEEALQERRGDMLVSYDRHLDGTLLEDTINREFVIFNEPYWTAQYPVFVFQADGETYALKADIGRHGDPSLAFPLFAEVAVDYLPENPEKALMNGKISARKTGEAFLNWFSRASEVFLTRWIYPGMFLLCSFAVTVVSFLFISMMTHPPKKLPPIPENKKEESQP